MKESIINDLYCPACQGKLECRVTEAKNNEIEAGVLTCKNCPGNYPVRDYIPRFVKEDNYAASFGLEWNKHSRTQIDKFNGTNISRDRFYSQTKWDKDLKNQKILEVGCGAGRFTQIAIETGAEVYSFDLSTAVDACLANNGTAKNLHIFQASIYELPFQKGYFDKIFCFGVLQHTPDVKKAFSSLVPYLKPGGEIVVDIYKKSVRNYFQSKYFLRIFTKQVDSTKLYILLTKVVPVLLPASSALKKIPAFGNSLSSLIPIINYKNVLPVKDEDLMDWAILDTFDMLSPRYDSPQTMKTLKRWFMEAGLTDIQVFSPGMIVGRGAKPDGNKS
ncbi:methyltransferase domain-containing protein [Candidatus Methanoperedens nitratireducens]|uniref:Methyltransferase domain protein n=1 Tax=Candidatus Methanoperedens nitratireducens TaxID=1392998 RepID=A0A284VUN6_9EURY|nr:methyltransferase domain-containing protein [Candidatus Methanoperedens nitroreducens]SNQ62992.1 Methyltransferase domain protein [Candidatus Methanoperedens nitroreducens]